MINRKCDCENEVSSRKLTVLKKRIFWKIGPCENVCLAIYDATLNNNRCTRMNSRT